jgi:hypothetical protein
MMKEISFAALAGIIAGLITLYILPAKFEFILWFIMIVLGGYAISKNFHRDFFKNGFYMGVVTGVFITLIHIVFISDYLSGHQEEVKMLNEIKFSNSIKLKLLALAPVYWVILGILTGISAVIWNKLSRKMLKNETQR